MWEGRAEPPDCRKHTRRGRLCLEREAVEKTQPGKGQGEVPVSRWEMPPPPSRGRPRVMVLTCRRTEIMTHDGDFLAVKIANQEHTGLAKLTLAPTSGYTTPKG